MVRVLPSVYFYTGPSTDFLISQKQQEDTVCDESADDVTCSDFAEKVNKHPKI